MPKTRAAEEMVVLITGTSSGIGKACADYLAIRGYRVYGTSRKAPFPPSPPLPRHWISLQMDVTQDDSVQRAINFIIQETGRLDVLVNNAGFGIAGAIEDTSIEEAKSQMETNFFGVLRVCRAVLPIMRAQKEGLIVNIGSLGGIIALPFQGLYSASKFALEGLTEALRLEVKPFGIRVTLIEPGNFRTCFTDNRVRVAAWKSESAYASNAERALQIMEEDERRGKDPEGVAILLERILCSSNLAPRYKVGPAFEQLAAFLKGILPGRLFEWALAKYYRLS